MIRSIAKNHQPQTAMNVHTILTNIVSFVTPKMHVTGRKAVIDCVHSLANGNAATATSIGRGIHSNAFEKHNIKRADRLLSNTHLLREQTLIYGAVCRLFCTAKHPTISIDWSDLDFVGRVRKPNFYTTDNGTNWQCISLLLLLSNLASLVLILLGVGLTIANQQRRFQANSYRDRRVLSFHSLGLRAMARQVMFTAAQWRNTLRHCKHLLDTASYNIECGG